MVQCIATPIEIHFFQKSCTWVDFFKYTSTYYDHWSPIFTLSINEDSMTSRSFWSWFRDRTEESRTMQIKIDNE